MTIAERLGNRLAYAEEWTIGRVLGLYFEHEGAPKPPQPSERSKAIARVFSHLEDWAAGLFLGLYFEHEGAPKPHVPKTGK